MATARETGEPELMVMGFAAAAAHMLSGGHHERAKAVLEELERLGETRADPYYAAALPGLVRCALELGEPALAARLIAGVEPRTPLQQHGLATGLAELAEAAGDPATAATGYADAAAHWRKFGDLPELASALLGEGRCLVALGTPGADAPLREARELLTTMGYAPASSETDTLLQRAEATAS